MRIYTHVNPDADAFCSAQMLYLCKQANLLDAHCDAFASAVACDTNVKSRLRQVALLGDEVYGNNIYVTDIVAESLFFDLVVDHHEVEGADLKGDTTYRDPAARSCTKVIWDKIVSNYISGGLRYGKPNAYILEGLAYNAALGYLGDNATASLEDVLALFSTNGYHPNQVEDEIRRAFKRHTDAMNARRTASADAIQHALSVGELVKVKGISVWLYICQSGELVASPSRTLSECLAPGRLYPAAIAAPVFAGKLVNADTVIVADPTGVSSFKGQDAAKFAALFGGGGHSTSAGGKGFTREAFARATANL